MKYHIFLIFPQAATALCLKMINLTQPKMSYKFVFFTQLISINTSIIINLHQFFEGGRDIKKNLKINIYIYIERDIDTYTCKHKWLA